MHSFINIHLPSTFYVLDLFKHSQTELMGSICTKYLVEEKEKTYKQTLTANCVQLVIEKIGVESPFGQNSQRRPH